MSCELLNYFYVYKYCIRTGRIVYLCPLIFDLWFSDPLGPLAHFVKLVFHPCLLAHLVSCLGLILFLFFSWINMVAIAIIFHNHILILI